MMMSWRKSAARSLRLQPPQRINSDRPLRPLHLHRPPLEALVGKKTAFAILAYAALSIFQALGAAGTATGPTATTAGQIMTTLIAGFGALGMIGKIDRGIKMLGLIAASCGAARS